MHPHPVAVTLIRKGEAAEGQPAHVTATDDGYLLTGLPEGLLDGGELLALVVHLVENEAGYVPEEADGGDGSRADVRGGGCRADGEVSDGR